MAHCGLLRGCRAQHAKRLSHFTLGIAAACCLAVCTTQPCRAEGINVSDPQTYRAIQDYMALLVNSERSKAGAGPVRFDPLAAQAAKQHADDMLRGGFFSHWDQEGLKPTRRYNLLGGFHQLAENLFYQSGQSKSVEELVQKAMETLMASEGHRRNMLAPEHTHLGVGIASAGGATYIVQEFISACGGEYRCPLQGAVGSPVLFTGRFDPAVHELAYVMVAFEGLPQPRTNDWLARTESYSDGDKIVAGIAYDRSVEFQDVPTTYGVRVDTSTGRFSCPVMLEYKGKEGLFYLTLWLKEKRTGRLFQAATATVAATK